MAHVLYTITHVVYLLLGPKILVALLEFLHTIAHCCICVCVPTSVAPLEGADHELQLMGHLRTVCGH